MISFFTLLKTKSGSEPSSIILIKKTKIITHNNTITHNNKIITKINKALKIKIITNYKSQIRDQKSEIRNRKSEISLICVR